MKNKLGFKLVLAIFLFSSLITLISTVVQIFLDYRSDIARLNNYEKIIRESYLESISTSVWLFDDKQVQTQLRGIAQLPDMEHLKIHTEEGTAWTFGNVDSKHNYTKEFSLSYKHKGRDIDIGTLNAVVSLDGIYKRLFHKTLIILASNAIKTFLVSGFTFLIFQYLLTRHLYSLSNWLRNLDIGKSFRKFQLTRPSQKSGKNDELDDVVSSINEMQDKLGKALIELKKSERKYKILTENIPIKVFHKDTSSAYVACNNKYAIGLQIEANQITGKTDFDFFPKELAERYRSDDLRIMKSQKIETLEEHYLQPDGQKAIVQTIKTPIWDENNEVVGLLGALVDITKMKKAEDDLQKSENKFKRLIDSLHKSLFFYSHDINGNFTYLSPSVKDVLGYSENEFLTHYSEYLTDNPINKEVVRYTDLSIKGIKQPPYEVEIFHKNGSIHRLQVAETPVYDDNNKVIAIEGLAHDITETKKIEQQLQQAQKMEAIGLLAGGIAHDFNNILNIITANASFVLSQSTPNGKLHEVLQEIDDGATRAQNLAQKLLTFAKGGKPIKETLDLNPLIKDAAVFITIGAKVKCEFNFTDNLWRVDADKGQIEQVINNLVINANQAMPQSGTIYINTQNVNVDPQTGIPLPAGRYIRITIKDEGMGISKKHFSNIFDPYFSTKQEGSGLGLATTYSIVKNHHGYISVESEIDRGTTFEIYLPASKKMVTQIENEQKQDIKHKGAGSILVMDDETLVLKVSKRILGSMGYEVEFAKDGHEAIDIYYTAFSSNNPFDLVILDLTIPGSMGGAETIPEILKINPEAKIAVSSGYSNDPVMANYKDHGLAGIIPKPYRQSQMAELLNNVLGQKA